MVKALLVIAMATLVGCAHTAQVREVPDTPLVSASEGAVTARSLAARAPLTVFYFFSNHCPCVLAHDARLRDLHERFRPRGVQFIGVDSEVGASPERARDDAKSHAYAFPILVDTGAKLASAFGVEYAGYAIIVDAQGRSHYSGGIDTDATHLRDDATPFVKDALDDLLAGREPRVAHGKSMGCALKTW